MEQQNLEKIAQWLKEADAVLIGAGAGASTEAGNDYTSKELFAKRYPALVKKGYECNYQLLGKQDWTENESWGYLLEHMNMVRFGGLPPAEVYLNLLKLVKDKDYFIITSNVDGLFEQHGFSKDKVYTPQGDFQYLQCATPCSRQVWASKAAIDAALPFLDKPTQSITNDLVVPKCKHCGGAATMNVRGGDYFLDDPYEQQEEKFSNWLTDTVENGKKLFIIEIGAGFNTPTVIRHRMEHITYKHPSAKMVRINMQYEKVHEILIQKGIAVGIKNTAAATFASLLKLL